MFAILIASGRWALSYVPTVDYAQITKTDRVNESQPSIGMTNISVLRNMAIAQLLLVVMTLTTAHVQIITRISSAYPVWLWYLAGLSKEGKFLGMFVEFMVLYSLIQAGLYASFLPPA